MTFYTSKDMAEMVKGYRERKGWTQSELGAQVDPPMTKQSVYRAETVHTSELDGVRLRLLAVLRPGKEFVPGFIVRGMK